jgi:flagella basal body P-ring formation protein FlgA
MPRLTTLLALIALCMPAAAQTRGPPATPALKASATVKGDLVRIGDLVDNAGTAAEIPIFRAPSIGETGSVPAASVLAAILPHNLITVDARGLTEVTVTRASRAITRQEIEARIAGSLTGQYGLGDPKNLNIVFDRDLRTIHIEPTATEDPQITRLVYDRRNGRFDVIFDVPGSEMFRRTPLRLTGTIFETVEIPMLARALAQGELVKASDLVSERKPKAELPNDVIDSTEQAIGLAARRPLRSGQPLRSADLARQELIARDHTVTITYEVPGVLLTMRGKALESGAAGDIINVLNIQSKRTLQATVTGPGRVSVNPSMSVITANGAASAKAVTDEPSSSAE